MNLFITLLVISLYAKCCTAVKVNHSLLVYTWKPSYFALKSYDEHARPIFSLHGYWPQNVSGLPIAANGVKIRTLKEQQNLWMSLITYWKPLKREFRNKIDIWIARQWNNHGSLDETYQNKSTNYYKTVISIVQNLKLKKYLKNAWKQGALHSNTAKVKLEDLHNLFKKWLKLQVSFVCLAAQGDYGNVKSGEHLLYQVYFTYDAEHTLVNRIEERPNECRAVDVWFLSSNPLYKPPPEAMESTKSPILLIQERGIRLYNAFEKLERDECHAKAVEDEAKLGDDEEEVPADSGKAIQNLSAECSKVKDKYLDTNGYLKGDQSAEVNDMMNGVRDTLKEAEESIRTIEEKLKKGEAIYDDVKNVRKTLRRQNKNLFNIERKYDEDKVAAYKGNECKAFNEKNFDKQVEIEHLNEEIINGINTLRMKLSKVRNMFEDDHADILSLHMVLNSSKEARQLKLIPNKVREMAFELRAKEQLLYTTKEEAGSFTEYEIETYKKIDGLINEMNTIVNMYEGGVIPFPEFNLTTQEFYDLMKKIEIKAYTTMQLNHFKKLEDSYNRAINILKNRPDIIEKLTNVKKFLDEHKNYFQICSNICLKLDEGAERKLFAAASKLDDMKEHLDETMINSDPKKAESKKDESKSDTTLELTLNRYKKVCSDSFQNMSIKCDSTNDYYKSYQEVWDLDEIKRDFVLYLTIMRSMTLLIDIQMAKFYNVIPDLRAMKENKKHTSEEELEEEQSYLVSGYTCIYYEAVGRQAYEDLENAERDIPKLKRVIHTRTDWMLTRINDAKAKLGFVPEAESEASTSKKDKQLEGKGKKGKAMKTLNKVDEKIKELKAKVDSQNYFQDLQEIARNVTSERNKLEDATRVLKVPQDPTKPSSS